jgi:mono/diheme cytochrome c family protein
MLARTLLTGVLLLAVSFASAVAQPRDSLPKGVSPSMVEQGRALYGGAGLCAGCHGLDATGGVGPDLTDTLWLHGHGSYAEIFELLVSGVTDNASSTGAIMPPRGGSTLTDEELRAVAAYVWTLSRRRGP